MKMGDYFGELSLCGDCIEDESFHYATTSCEYKVNGVDAGEAICHTVNNNDKLVEALSRLIEPAGMYSQLLRNHPRMATEADKVEMDARNALKLLKELGHEI